MDWISLLITLLMCFTIYFLFEKYGFKEGFLFKLFCQLGIYYLDGTLNDIYSKGMNQVIAFLLIIIVVVFIFAGIEYYIFNITNSFFGFLILCIIFESIIYFFLSAIILAYTIQIINYILNVIH